MFTVFVILIVLLIIYINLIKKAERARNLKLVDRLLAPARYVYQLGIAGAFMVAGVIIHSWDMYLKLTNPVSYANFTLFKWIPIISGICFVLAIIVSIGKSLYTTSSIGLFIVLGLPLIERLNICVVGMAGGIEKALIELFLVMMIILILIGPAVCLDIAAIMWFFGYLSSFILIIGIPIMVASVVGIGSGAIEGIFKSGAMYGDYELASVNIPLLILTLVSLIPSRLIEKPKMESEKS